MSGDVFVSSFERGSAQPRHARPRTFPPVHEAAVVRPLPVTSCARAHLPRRQARALRGDSKNFF